MNIKQFTSRLYLLLAARWLRNLMFGFFVFEALWFVFSAVYPMAFDEDFHFGIIKMYAHHWLPFLGSQPPGADAYGAVARDPSYLYHYAMSFPYRLLEHITSNQTAQIITLRLINVALFTLGLALFYRFMMRVLGSRAIANTSLALFILIPIVPQLAAHINYDNLLMPLTAYTFLLVFDVQQQLKRRAINFKTLFILLNVCLLTSLVKYAYLPVFVAAGLFVLGYGKMQFRHSPAFKMAFTTARASFSAKMAVGFVLLTLLSGGLFIQRYGVNAIKYHKPIVDCGAVLDYSHCSAYGPWIRNYDYAEVKTTVDKNPFKYFISWEQGLRSRLFFAINTPMSGYVNYPPLPLPYQTALVLGVAGVLTVLVYARRIFAEPYMVFAGLATVAYLIALFMEDYSQFVETAQPVAINGRYLLPVLFLLACLFARGFQLLLASPKKAQLKPILATLVLLCFLQGGGVMTFILRSDASWDWPNSTVVHINNAARKVLAPMVWEGSKYY